jgi:transcription antitermination factor NusG
MTKSNLEFADTSDALAKASEWYALYTRHQHEKTVAQHLQRIGYDVFLPLYRETHQWNDRKKDVVLPLFPCYVFFAGNLDRRFEVMNLPGVCSLITHGDKVSVISAEELETVRRVTTSSLPVEPHPYLQCGERIRVLSGPLTGVEGIVARRKDALRIVLSVEMLARSVAVEIDEALVERVQCA